jgi:hypothetical protein
MNEFDGVPLQFLPEPPRNLRAAGTPEGVSVAWDEPAEAGAGPVESYWVARSENGYGFGNPVRVPGNQTAVTLTHLPRGKDVYFRVTAVNAGGESLPSAVAGCRPARTATAPRVLVVNAFTEFSRFNNPRQTLRGTNYIMPSAVGKMDRVIQGEFMKESHPRKWVLEARHLEAGGFCLVVVGRVLAAIACRMRLVRGGFGPPRIWFGHSPPVRLFASSAAPE